MDKQTMMKNERSTAYRAAKQAAGAQSNSDNHEAESTEDGDDEQGMKKTPPLRPAEARSRRKANVNSTTKNDNSSSGSDNFPSRVMQRGERYKQAKQQKQATKPGAVRVTNSAAEEDNIANSKVPHRSERYWSQKKNHKDETRDGEKRNLEDSVANEKIPYRAERFRAQKTNQTDKNNHSERKPKKDRKNKFLLWKKGSPLGSESNDQRSTKQPGTSSQSRFQRKGPRKFGEAPNGLSQDTESPEIMQNAVSDTVPEVNQSNQEWDGSRVGAQAIPGINSRGDGSSQLQGSSSLQTDYNDDNAGLVEAQLVKAPELLQAQAMDVPRIRRLAMFGGACVVVVGLAIGVGLGLSIGGGSGDLNVIDNQISAIDFYALDFENHTRSPSKCFETMEELYDAVDAYVSLRFEVEELLASSEQAKYLQTRNESLKERDEIASIYGWPIGQFCVSKIKSLKRLFSPVRGGVALIDFNEDISTWDTSSVVNFDETFLNSAGFNQPLKAWNTSHVTTLAGTFSGSSTFNQHLSAWDVSRVRTMEKTFSDASRFNQPIGTWKTGRVSNMENMFLSAAVFNQDINAWDVQQVTSLLGMFDGAVTFNQDLSRWRLSSATDLSRMFLNAKSFNQPSLCEWELGWKRFQGNHSEQPRLLHLNMFYGASCSLDNDPVFTRWPNTSMCGDCRAYFRTRIKNWSRDATVVEASVPVPSSEALREAVDSYMRYRLGRHPATEVSNTIKAQISQEYGWPVGAWNVSLITDFSHTFSRFRSSLVGVFDEDIGNWDVSNGRSFVSMFSGSALFNQNLSRWKVSKATDMSSMFGGARSLFTNVGAASFNHDISEWDVSSVTDMTLMFYGAGDFNQILTTWDTSRVEAMDGMFESTLAFTSNLPWNVTKVRTFHAMFLMSRFAGDISQWQTSNGGDFARMFANNIGFNGDISAWNVSAATTMAEMFSTSQFNHGGISSWEPRNCISFSHMFRLSSAWNHSLCSWGPFLRKVGTSVDAMFIGTSCNTTESPDLTAVPVSPMCVECG